MLRYAAADGNSRAAPAVAAVRFGLQLPSLCRAPSVRLSGEVAALSRCCAHVDVSASERHDRRHVLVFTAIGVTSRGQSTGERMFRGGAHKSHRNYADATKQGKNLVGMSNRKYSY